MLIAPVLVTVLVLNLSHHERPLQFRSSGSCTKGPLLSASQNGVTNALSPELRLEVPLLELPGVEV
jgi:hypothetical protein